MKRKKIPLFALLLCLLLSTVLISDAAVYRTGDSGTQVKRIQQKLMNWGYFGGPADGLYGSKTAAAVKYFQRSNGLTPDGVCGAATLRALGMAAGEPSLPAGAFPADSDDVYLMARMISAESRGEPYAGQVAVGAVILNRVESAAFPNTIAEVIYQPGAFSALLDGQFDQPIADSARRAAKDALAGSDPSGGAVYYYNPRTATSRWIFSRPTVTTIGRHVFAR